MFNIKITLNGILLTCFCFSLFQFVDIGIVTSIESNHKQIDTARKGQEICIKIEPIPGESPKMFGRHFEAEDMLMSKVSFLWQFVKCCRPRSVTERHNTTKYL